jgi:hypothetical protein
MSVKLSKIVKTMSDHSHNKEAIQRSAVAVVVESKARFELGHLRGLLSIGLIATIGLMLSPVQGVSQVAVNDTTGWTAWDLGDFNADQQTGSGYDDLVGDVTTPMMQQQTGMLNSEDVVLFRVRMRVFSAENDWANGGNLGLGMDLDGDNAVDLIGMFEQNSNHTQAGATYFTWGTPGTDLNDGPSTTDYVNQNSPGGDGFNVPLTAYDSTANSGAGNADVATFWYSVTTEDWAGEAGGAGSDAWMTFAVSYDTFNTGIDTYSSAAFKTTAGFSTFDFDASTQIGYVLFTSQQSNSFNQDMGGFNGQPGATDTFASMGSIVTVSAGGSPAPVPEPSTFAQLGGMLLAGLALQLRRRRRVAKPDGRSTES